MLKATIAFNRELIFGECGALLVVNPVASLTSRFTREASVISASAVAGTLAGGALFWLAARIYDNTRQEKLDVRRLAGDIGYFTPAAVVLGFAVYDPAIYFISRHLLKVGDKVTPAVFVAQAAAFLLFLLCMNGYRVILLKLNGRQL
jgi:hypothetical protein